MTREIVSSVTSKGQVTIPVEVRRKLGVKPRDKVAFVLDDSSEVRLARSTGVVARSAGFAKRKGRTPSVDELRKAGESAIARDAVSRPGG